MPVLHICLYLPCGRQAVPCVHRVLEHCFEYIENILHTIGSHTIETEAVGVLALAEKVREEIAKDKYTGDVLLSDDGKELFYDFYSGRYFNATKEEVLRAEYELNRELYVNGYARVNTFYECLGLEPRPEYDEIGWTCGQLESMYWHTWIEFEHTETNVDEGGSDGYDGMPCTIVYMPLEPVIDAEFY